MSTASGAPVQIICQREEEEEDRSPLLQAAPRDDGGGGCLDGCCEEENLGYYIGSCFYFFFCHSIDSVLLHICCCRCLSSHLTPPDELLPRNGPQKVFAFCIKFLSNLWTSALLLFIVRWAFLRPFDVQPMLGACIVNDFDLRHHSTQPPATDLGFNFTTHLLFKNSHHYYSVGYDYPAAAVYYAGEKLGPADDEIPEFKQEPLQSRVVDQVVVGRLRNASSTVVETFLKDKGKGRFDMVMRIRVTLSYKYWPFKEDYLTFYECPLSSPVPHVGDPAMSSQALCNTVKI